jgi:copper chaperone
MEQKTFTVPAIGCNGCVRAIENEVGELAGVASVKAAVNTKQVVVEWGDPASWEQIKAALVAIEYPPQEA